MSERVLNTAIVTSIVLYVGVYIAQAIVKRFSFNINNDTLNVIFAFGFHFFVMVATAVYFFKIKNAIIKGISVYAFIFSLVCLVSFIAMGLFFNKPYFFYKAALLLSIPIGCIAILIEKIINNKKHANTQ